MMRYDLPRVLAVAGLVLACAGGNAQARHYYRAYQDTPQWRQGNSDQAFARRVAQANRAEIRLGRLAMSRANGQGVREFARQMVNDHRAALQELKTLASDHGMTLPSEMNSEQRATYERLSDLRGAAFDRAYIGVMVRNHQKTVREFEAKADGRDSALQDWASEKLPLLRHHRDMALELRESLRHGIR